jgi:hypothetical protein
MAVAGDPEYAEKKETLSESPELWPESDEVPIEIGRRCNVFWNLQSEDQQGHGNGEYSVGKGLETLSRHP